MAAQCPANINTTIASEPLANRSARRMLRNIATRIDLTQINTQKRRRYYVGDSGSRLLKLKLQERAFC